MKTLQIDKIIAYNMGPKLLKKDIYIN